MVERFKAFREQLYRQYRERDDLRKAFIKGSLNMDEYDSLRLSLESEIAVDEHKLARILEEKRGILHQHLKELNTKQRGGEIDEELYNKAYCRLSQRISRVGLYLSEVDEERSLYSYLAYGKNENLLW